MLISTRFADTAQIHLVKMPGGARTQLTFYPDSVSGAQYSPASGNSFVFSKDIGGNEFFQVYRFNNESGDVTLLTDGKSRNVAAVWSYDGQKLAYGSTRRNGNYVVLYVVEPANSKSDRMLTQLQGGGWEPLDWSPDNRKILVREEISAKERYLWNVNASNGEKNLITPKGSAKIAYGGSQFSKDGKGIYVTTDKDSEFQRLAYVDPASKQHNYLTSHIYSDVDEFYLSNDVRTIAFVTNEDGFGVLHLLDTKTAKEKPVPDLPKGIASGVRWHKNNRDLGFNITSARSTSDVYSLDVQTGKVDRWTYSETGGLNTANFSEPQLIHWKSWDGREISGFLYRPPAKFTGKRPVIVNIHGGPEGQFRPGFLGRNNYYLNELGLAMIFPNVRGSTGYGKTFLTMDNGLLREGSYKDIDSLFDWIQTQSDLDANRVLVTGGSYGGFMTLAVATNYNGRICCSVDVVGPSNLVTFLERTSGYRQDLRRVEYGDERDLKMGGNELSVAAAVLNEDFVCSRSRNNHARYINSLHIALQCHQVAQGPALICRKLDSHRTEKVIIRVISRHGEDEIVLQTKFALRRLDQNMIGIDLGDRAVEVCRDFPIFDPIFNVGKNPVFNVIVHPREIGRAHV